MIILLQTLGFHTLLHKGLYGQYDRSTQCKVEDIYGLKAEFLKWVAKDVCEPITMLFNLVAREGFQASWTINIIE